MGLDNAFEGPVPGKGLPYACQLGWRIWNIPGPYPPSSEKTLAFSKLFWNIP